MVVSRGYLLLLAFASVKVLVAEEQSVWNKIFKRNDWNDKSNYVGVDFNKATKDVDWNKDVDWDTVFGKNSGGDSQPQPQSQSQSQSGGGSPPVDNKSYQQESSSSGQGQGQGQGQTQGQGQDHKDNSQDNKSQDQNNTDNNNNNNNKNNHPNDDTHSDNASGGCDYDQNASGDKSSAVCPDGCSMTIAFTDNTCKGVKYAAGNGGSPSTGDTHGTCICMSGGSVRVNVGATDTSKHGTLIEGNGAGLSDASFFDVSYVEGYSWPVVCWNADKPDLMSGSNIDLYAHGKCDGQDAKEMGDICINPGYKMLATRDAKHDCMKCTMPSAFFAPASGAAYTYPYDDCPCASGPSKDGEYRSPMATGGKLLCCVGPQCKPNTYSMGGQTANGNCQRGDCQPCEGMGKCGACEGNAKPAGQKRDMEVVLAYAEKSLAYSQESRPKRRHAHHHHHNHGAES